jgi:hypothetical protein
MVQPVSANQVLENGIKASCKRLVQDNNVSQQDILLSNFIFLLTMSLEANGEIWPHGMQKFLFKEYQKDDVFSRKIQQS